MIIFDKHSKNLEIPAGLGNLEVNIVSGTTYAGVLSLNGQTGDLKLKTINGNDVLGEGDIRTSGSPEEIITSAVTEANAYTDEKVGAISIPSKTSQLTNDSGFVNSAETQSAIYSALTDYSTSADTQSAISAATANMVTSTYVNKIWVGTTAQYGQISPKDPNTLYFINDN